MQDVPTKVFSSRMHIRKLLDSDVQHPAHLFDLLSGIQQTVQIPIILRDGPGDVLGVDAAMVPVEQSVRIGHVLCDGLLGQNMFPSR